MYLFSPNINQKDIDLFNEIVYTKGYYEIGEVGQIFFDVEPHRYVDINNSILSKAIFEETTPYKHNSEHRGLTALTSLGLFTFVSYTQPSQNPIMSHRREKTFVEEFFEWGSIPYFYIGQNKISKKNELLMHKKPYNYGNYVYFKNSKDITPFAQELQKRDCEFKAFPNRLKELNPFYAI